MKGFYKVEGEGEEQANTVPFPSQDLLFLRGYRRALVHVQSIIGKKHLLAKMWQAWSRYTSLLPFYHKMSFVEGYLFILPGQ